ncbi:MAG: hypothetical protein K6U14_11335 [Firmicutes bacterium]|nr:hypothetical protein [Alicyclobacillaceae bacterium]MCL6498206.1 hypothetical protein [Bacillota bacterium]
MTSHSSLLGAGLWVAAGALVVGAWLVLPLTHSYDVAEYQRYAAAALSPPWFTRWPREYPPLSLAVFLLPRLLPLPYPDAFAAVTAGAYLGLLWWVRRRLDLAAAWRLLGYTALGGGFVLEGRYDVVAAAVAALALAAVEGRRFGQAWAWAGAGFLVKLFPAAVAPVAALVEARQTRRLPWARGGWTAAGVAAVVIGAGLRGGPGAWSWVGYFAGRPPEVGSVVGELAALADPKHRIVFGFGSINVVSPWTAPLGALLAGLAAAVVVGVLVQLWRGRIGPVTATLTILTAVLLGSKVFSVQFLLWFLPWWSYYRFSPWWAGTAVASSLAYPFAYNWASAHPAWWNLDLGLLLARSILLAGGVWAVWRTPMARRL